jgi:hypothetical protein
MSVIKERILFNNQDINLKIDLGVDNSVYGYQQGIDEQTEQTKEDLVNPVIDYEVQRFSFKANQVRIPNFYFDNVVPADFTEAGFTTSEIEDFDDVLLNSFFIWEYYDSFDPYTQTKIFTIYNTQVLEGSTSGGVAIPAYVLNNDNLNQFYHWYVPKSYLDLQTGTTVTGYVRFSFYNAKTGQIHLFYNRLKEIDGIGNPERQYFDAVLDLVEMTWEFPDAATFGVIPAYEYPRTSAYVNRVNETFNNFENLQQQAPEGAFDPADGTYEGFSARSRARGSASRTAGSTGDRTVGDRDLSSSTPRDETSEEDPEIIERPTRPEIDRDAEDGF